MTLAYTPAQYSAFFGSVTATVAVITGLVAVFTFLSLRRDSRDRSRPVMIAELLPVVLSEDITELVVRNVGPTVAKNVTVSFDPAIPDVSPMSRYIVLKYAAVIPTVGPGTSLRNVYAHFVDSEGTTDEPVPSDFIVSISYSDGHGRRYVDSSALSLSTLLHQTRAVPSNTDEPGMRRRLVGALEAIARGVGRY